MKYIRAYSIVLSIIIIFSIVFGCASQWLESSEYTGRLDKIIFWIRSSIQLSSFNMNDNIAGFDSLGERYNLDVTTPALAFFEAAEEFVTVLKQLHAKMKASRAPLDPDTQYLFQELEKIPYE